MVKYGNAYEVLLNDTYKGNIFSGEDSREAKKEIQSKLVKSLNYGGMQLHKCNSNHLHYWKILIKSIWKVIKRK